MTEAELRGRFVRHLEKHDGCLYRWGGTFPALDRRGDCSGLGCRVCWDLDIIPASLRLTSRYIHTHWEPTEDPQLGDAVTYAAIGGTGYLPARLAQIAITHVMWITGPAHRVRKPGDEIDSIVYPVIGASGGGRLTRTVEQARAKGAKVKRYASHEYRNYVAGFRSLPITAEMLEA